MLARRTCTLGSVLLLLLASPAWPRTLTLRPDGTGDVPTFQAGVDTFSRPDGQCLGPDTLLVEPGYYQEDVNFSRYAEVSYPCAATILCPGGPNATRVRSLEGDALMGSRLRDLGVIGLGIVQQFKTSVFHGISYQPLFENCRFEGGFTSGTENAYSSGLASMKDCEFDGPVVLSEYDGWLSGCHFLNAQVYAAALDFDFGFRDCDFSGASTVVITRPGTEDAIHFERCSFRGMASAIRGDDKLLSASGIEIKNCVFEGITGAAVDFTVEPNQTTVVEITFPLVITGSRFEGCATGVRLAGAAAAKLSMKSDTLRGGTSPIVADVAAVDLDGLLVEGSAGDGIRVRLVPRTPSSRFGVGPPLRALGSVRLVTSRGNAGVGIVLADSTSALPLFTNFYVALCRAENNRAGGISVLAETVLVTSNVASGNGGIGLSIHEPPQGTVGAILRNTIIANAAGMLLSGSGLVPLPVSLDATNNLVAYNVGPGIDQEVPLRSLVHNDSWANGALDYAGIATPAGNLEVDPQLCDPVSGEFSVTSSSPCAPSGPFGQIGAFGPGCDARHIDVLLVSEHTKDHGAIRLAILGNRFFDPRTVDPASVALEGAVRAGEALSFHDVDGDGRPDALIIVKASQGAGTIAVTARTRDGVPLAGSIALLGHAAEELASTVELPEGAALSLRVVSGDPMRSGTMRVLLSLPTSEPARVEILDIAGRRIATHDLSGLGAGSHALDLADVGWRPDGVYFLRLVQGYRAVSLKAVLARSH